MGMQKFTSLFRLDGRIALVAGAASGIGRAAAKGLSAAGAHTFCADVNGQGAEQTAAQIRADGGAAEALTLDITDEASVASAIERITKEHARIDVLVSTPAVNVRKPLLSYTGEEFDKVLRLNLKGTFLIAQAVGRVMVEHKRGSIILLSSIRSVTVEPGQGVYATTKAPLTLPIKSRPDWYNAYASKNALGRWATAEEMAGPIVFLASDASSYVTGAVLFADGGWTAIDGRFQPPI
jgi:NAD(P)-dependent dehydrogenase (short-subunit alcohol dehydrogenase family)